MTAAILLIALAQAAVILVTAGISRSLASTLTATLFMSLFAVATGNPAYAIIDLVAIWVVFFSLREWLVTEMAANPAAHRAPTPTAQPESEAWAWGVYLVCAIVLGAFFLFHSDPPAPAAPQPAPPQASSPKKDVPAKPASQRKAAHDARQCLDLKTDRAIAACAEKYR